MPVIKALPGLEIIRGLKGILDFYYWKGIPCVRKWPVIPPASRTPASLASAALFGAVVQGYSLLGGVLKLLFSEDAADQPRTTRDLYVSAVLGHLHEINMDEVIALLEQNNAYLLALQDVLNALNSIGTDLLITMPANDGDGPQQLLVDGERHLQADVLSSALPALASTAAHQVTQNTALALIEKLEHALATIHTDELRTRPGENAAGYQSLLLDDEGHLQVDILGLPDPFDVANLRSAGLIRYDTYIYSRYATETRRKWLTGQKVAGIADNTYFDILEFNQATAATSTNAGGCSGVLTILARGRDTTGFRQFKVERYHILVVSHTPGSNLTLYQTSLSSQEESGAAITISLQKTGATTTYLKLQAKYTHTNWDATTPTAAWTFDCQYHGNDATRIPLPSVA